MTRIYFVRHGEALGNALKQFQGVTDHPLTEKGTLQGRLLGRRFATIEYDMIYASPLMRAVETAKLLNQAQQKPIVRDAALLEICGGPIEEVPLAELHSRFPEHMKVWDETPWLFVAPLMEDGVAELYERMERTLARLVRNHPNQTLVLSAHGYQLRVFNCIAQGLPMTEIGKMGWGDNACVSCACFEQGQKPKVEFINDTSHITPELATPDFWIE